MFFYLAEFLNDDKYILQMALKIIQKDESYMCLGDLIGEGLITSNGKFQQLSICTKL